MSSIEGVGVNILFGFAVSGTALVVHCCDNNLALEYGIQPLVLSGKRAVLLILNFLKVSRVLTMYSVTFLSGVMIVEKLHVIKLTIIPVFFISL